jgi:hypothetical protein
MKRIPFIFLFFFLFSPLFKAQIVIEEEPDRLYYDFAIKRITKFKDMRNFRDVFHKDRYWMGKNRLSGNIAYNTGRIILADDVSSEEVWRQALSFMVKFRFWEQFAVTTNYFIDFNKKASARWISDFSYTVGRYNWKPNKFNYGYENYLNNKYTDKLEEIGNKFFEGYYFLSYQNVLPEKMAKAIALDESTVLKFNYFVRYALNYRDEFNQIHWWGRYWGKTTLGIASRFTIYKNIYLEGALYYYPEQFKRQPWDPDYTYGFGYFDWRSFRVSITYGNWAINRFNPKDKPYPQYGFLDGQFRIVGNWIW